MSGMQSGNDYRANSVGVVGVLKSLCVCVCVCVCVCWCMPAYLCVCTRVCMAPRPRPLPRFNVAHREMECLVYDSREQL